MIPQYVDNILIAASSISIVNSVKLALPERFEMKDLGEAHTCPGIKTSREKSQQSLTIRQLSYAQKLLDRLGILEARPFCTPMEHSPTRDNIEGETSNGTIYREAIDRLVYLMFGTRPDLPYALEKTSFGKC